MRNSIKKVLCTALAAVSFSAVVTVPSSLNNPNSDNVIFNVIEAEAKAAIKYQNYTLNSDERLFVTLEEGHLNGRLHPDGNKICTVLRANEFGRLYRYNINEVRIEKYTETENRVWGHVQIPVDYPDKSWAGKWVWICLYRGIKNGNIYDIKKQAICDSKNYGTGLNSKFQTGASNPGFYWNKENINKKTFYCHSINGKHYVDLV